MLWVIYVKLANATISGTKQLHSCRVCGINTARVNEFSLLMKNKYAIFGIVAIITIGILFLTKFNKPAITSANPPEIIPGTIDGTKLKLVAKYDPLHIYIYVDTASTNKLPSYAVFQGYEPIVFRENTSSNTVETTHFENGLYVLETERDDSGRILERFAEMYDNNDLAHQLSSPIYSYIDTNGDGLWDDFFIYGKNGERTKVLVRSNLCWVPIQQQDGNH
jgi:hypothetical protein